jgi:ABC-type uncharacterized transport system ATPase subunit
LSALPEVRRAVCEVDTITLHLRNAEHQAELFSALAGLGLTVTRLELRRPTLGDVYLSATNGADAAKGGDSDD